MNREFEAKIKKIEQELIDLKTATEYTSVRSANYNSSFNVSVGLYKITYADEGVFSIIYSADASGSWGAGIVYPRTPNGNVQYVEVGYSEFIIPGSSTETTPMVVISNTPVLSIERV